jgi:hypothetical protein
LSEKPETDEPPPKLAAYTNFWGCAPAVDWKKSRQINAR